MMRALVASLLVASLATGPGGDLSGGTTTTTTRTSLRMR